MSEHTREVRLGPQVPCGDAPSAPGCYGWFVWGATLGVLVLICVMAAGSGHWLYHHWPLIGMAMVVGILLVSRAWGGRWLTSPSTAAFLAWVCAVAFALRAACVLGIPYLPCADFEVYHEAGVTMARSWSLRIQPVPDSTYRCFFPPGQVFSLGVLYKLFNNSFRAGQMLNVVYATLTVVGVWYVARRLFGELTARVAALLAAVFPSMIFGCMLLGAEVPEAFWGVLAMCFFVGRADRDGRWWAALACGMCIGIGALIRPTYVLLPAPIALHMLLTWSCRRKALLAAVTIALGVAVVVGPWTYRNYRVTGGFVLISSNGGGNLYSANNDNADGAYTAEAWDWLYENARDDLMLQSLGFEAGTEWIRTHPRQFTKLAIRKFVLFWHTDKEIPWWALEQTHIDNPELGLPRLWQWLGQSVSTGYYTASLLAVLLGVWRWRKRLLRERAWMIIPLLGGYFTAVHMVFESQGKYHYMLMPLLCILAALATTILPGAVFIEHSSLPRRRRRRH